MKEARTVAALYLDVQNGPYAQMHNVECWGVERDARTYAGPHSVVAHPPCQAWGRLRICRKSLWRKHGWSMQRINDDAIAASCGPIAVDQVRAFGGVLEHPAQSALWHYCNLPLPGRLPDVYGGITIEIDQGHYGHPCPKRTWLYVCGAAPTLKTTPSNKGGRVLMQSSCVRHLTPHHLAEVLVGIARSTEQPQNENAQRLRERGAA